MISKTLELDSTLRRTEQEPVPVEKAPLPVEIRIEHFRVPADGNNSPFRSTSTRLIHLDGGAARCTAPRHKVDPSGSPLARNNTRLSSRISQFMSVARGPMVFVPGPVGVRLGLRAANNL